MTDETKSRQELIDELNALRRENERLRQAAASDKDQVPGSDYRPEQTILIVDDNENTRSIVADLVEELGYEPLSAATPKDAVDLVKKTDKRIDLVISDIVMPGEDGPDMMDQILKIQPEIKVIFMSGYEEDEIVHDSVYKVQDSSAAFIKKPFTLAELDALLQKQMTE